jgi:hypothetical protein
MRLPNLVLLSVLLQAFAIYGQSPPQPANKLPSQASKTVDLRTTALPTSPVDFVFTGFENGSPLNWQFDSDGTVEIYLLYDNERSSPNRAAGHWFFQLQGRKGADARLVLNNFDNVWNGIKGSPISASTIGFVSADTHQWRPIRGKLLDGNRLELKVHFDAPKLWLARLPVYRLSELQALTSELSKSPQVEIRTIGKTVEGRPLEIIRVGRADAPHRVLLRARAHPWEPGGNWVTEGLLRRLVQDDDTARRWLARYCVYVMPMANKDGVVRGRTRFNLQGKDLNRQWGGPADPELAPENAALEQWLAGMLRQKRLPELMLDLHNDEAGRLHISRPNVDLTQYLKRMKRLEALLVKDTWFREGSTDDGFRNPGTIGDGLLERFGIDACVLELNANWIAGLNDYPSADHWKSLGQQLGEVFFEYFEDNGVEQNSPRSK